MIYDAIIIGGGVIGLSILHTSLLSNYNTILIEQNLHLLDKASGRNSGILCTGVDAPCGSLERALIRDSISRVREFCLMYNVPMRECGSLVCLWPWDDDTSDSVDEKKFDGLLDDEKISRDRLQQVLHESHIAGDTDAIFLSSSTISKMEPSLSTECRGAIHIPGETVVDPWLFPLALATHSREIYNAKKKKKSRHDKDDDSDVIYTGRRVVMEESTFDKESGLWTIVTRRTTANIDEDGDTRVTYTARCVINAAGIDSDLVQSQASADRSGDDTSNSLLPRPTFEARPRRGQYAIFAAPPDDIPTRPIQPVPSQFTKGIFVYSTLYDQIVVGPTAQDQSSRTDDTIDPAVANELTRHASRILGQEFNSKPQLIGQYVGIRPGTTKRDYQIQLHTKSNFITVGGIRSTGLTASLGIGRHVVQCLLSSIVSPPPIEDDDEEELRQSILRHPTPLPNVKELVKQYHQRGDGTIVIGGHVYKVTHPLTKLGWDARSGIAAFDKFK